MASVGARLRQVIMVASRSWRHILISD